MPYQQLADAVLVLHVSVVMFVVGSLPLIFLGNTLEWRWVNNRWFRVAHLAAIAFIAVQAWLGQLCPLTLLESWLRVRGSGAAYAGSFIEHWLRRLIFYQAPTWVFTLAYTLFGALVVFAWWRFPPRRRRNGTGSVQRLRA